MGKNRIMQKMLSALLAVLFVFSVGAHGVSAAETYFDLILSGEEEVIIGETYVLKMTFTNFRKSEFLGASCKLIYNSSVFELDSDYKAAISGVDPNSTAITDNETFPLISPEAGWVFWAASGFMGTDGVLNFHVLNNSSALTALKGDKLECFATFKVKEGIRPQNATFRIDSELLGTFSLSEIETYAGSGTSLTVSVIEEPQVIEETALQLAEGSKLTLGQHDVAEAYALSDVRQNTKVSDLKKEFANDPNLLTVENEGTVLGDDDTVGTGCIVKLTVDGEVKDSAVVICRGDIDGSGVVDTTDSMRIKMSFLGLRTMTKLQVAAADVDGNGAVDSSDFLRVKMAFLGLKGLYD